MLRSRVLSSIDTERLANAVARPGIDPRIWISYAVLTTEPKVNLESDGQDVFADVMLMPSGTLETARVGAIYAGNGFGLYAPLHKDDEVLVCAPSGDPDQGLVITQRFWSPADPPPDAVKNNPEDVTLVVEAGKNLRLNVQGAGNVILGVDSGKVYLGAPDGTEPAAKGTSLKSYLDTLVTAIQAHTHPVQVNPATGTGAATPTATPIPSPPSTILSTTTEVK